MATTESGSTLLKRRTVAEAALVCFLLACYVALSLSAVWRKSFTFDELYHLTVGISHWQTGDYHFHPENGLAQEWAALGVLGACQQFPPLDERPWSQVTPFQLGKKFFF